VRTVLELSSAGRGKKGLLRKKLRASRTYAEWKEAAQKLDEHLHFDEWKSIEESTYYDWRLVRKVSNILFDMQR
jgi:hypothetical protein